MAKKSADDIEFEVLCKNMRAVLNTTAGRKVIWHLLSLCNLYVDNFTGNSQTFFLEGKRSVGLEILQLLESADKKAYPQLLLANIEMED